MALGLSIYGAKSIAKSNAASAEEATKYDGILKGSWESVKHVFKKSAEPFQNSFKGVGNAYKGASLTGKVTNAAKHVKDNAIAEGKAFGKQVHKNANDILFGSVQGHRTERDAEDLSGYANRDCRAAECFCWWPR